MAVHSRIMPDDAIEIVGAEVPASKLAERVEDVGGCLPRRVEQPAVVDPHADSLFFSGVQYVESNAHSISPTLAESRSPCAYTRGET